MNEFSLIDRYFKPLAASFPGSLHLSDDAAILSLPPGQELVVTKDAISQGVHFIGDEAPELIAKKLLRVNLSDLAAMGATPLCYFLAVMLPPHPNPLPQAGEGSAEGAGEGWLSRFTAGLAEDQTEFGIALAGGDTIATHGPPSFSITAVGTVPTGHALRRNGAKGGDSIYVSGTLGDSALGLHLLRHPRAGGDPFLINRYLLPQPRLTLGQKLRGIASACMDISDGLVQDVGHICAASGVGAIIERNKLPLSSAARRIIETDNALWDAPLSGGDDYELLFTVPPNKQQIVPSDCTCIGVIKNSSGVSVLDDKGQLITLSQKGFRHF